MIDRLRLLITAQSALSYRAQHNPESVTRNSLLGDHPRKGRQDAERRIRDERTLEKRHPAASRIIANASDNVNKEPIRDRTGACKKKKTAKSFVRGAGGETSRWFLRVWRDAGFIGKA